MKSYHRWANKAFRKLYWKYRKGAHDRGLDFNLSKDLFTKLITAKECFYCLKEPYQETQGVKVLGIDRMESSIGYKEINCVPCCKQCNNLKGTLSFDNFKIKISNG